MGAKKIVSTKSKVMVVLAMVTGFVFLGLTSYYLYAGYVAEQDSSAASCKAQKYECTCKNGTKQTINYSYCARGAKGYDQCLTLDKGNQADLATKKQLDKEKSEFMASRYENVRKNVGLRDGADNILNAKECFEAGWCKSENVTSDGKLDWKTSGTYTMYQRYVEFMKKYNAQVNTLTERMQNREKEITKNTCSQILAAYEKGLVKDRDLRCQKACGDLKTVSNTDKDTKTKNVFDLFNR